MARKQWKKQTLKLRDDHTWRSKPGCKIFVAGRGAVRFDFPADWVVVPATDSIELYDKNPPDDDCRLAVSYLELPPIDWSGLPLRFLLEQANQGDPRPIHHRGEILESRRGNLEIAWRELQFVDPVCRREARSHFCLARKGKIQALITFDYWASDAERCLSVWNTVLETLELDEQYADPARGRTIH